MSNKKNVVRWFEIAVTNLKGARYRTVSDIDKAIALVKNYGGKITPAKASGDFGFIAHFKDCEGNVVALYSEN
jgi:predicted enzyme related to lactoylglutathione lyase